MCGAPEQTASLPAGIDIEKETVLYGTVSLNGSPVPGAYVRLLDGTDEFTAEVITSPTGDFRFFAAPGQWTLSVLHKDGKVRESITAASAGLHRVPLELA